MIAGRSSSRRRPSAAGRRAWPSRATAQRSSSPTCSRRTSRCSPRRHDARPHRSARQAERRRRRDADGEVL